MKETAPGQRTPDADGRNPSPIGTASLWDRFAEIVYNALPLSWDAKVRLKSFLFRRLPFLFKHTSAYYHWKHTFQHGTPFEDQGHAEIKRLSKLLAPDSLQLDASDWIAIRDRLAALIDESALSILPLEDAVGSLPSREISSDELAAYVTQITALNRSRGATDGARDVSIIIPVYNQLHLTLACIRSILMWTSRFSFEIIVVDDCSTDLTGATLRSVDAIRYVENAENAGFILSCNRGVAQALGEYVVILNNDTVVMPRWLDELIGTLECVPGAGLVGSKLLFSDGTLQEAGGIVWEDGSAWNHGRFDDPRRPMYNYVRDADYVSGASLALRRDLWESLGGFDHRYIPAYYEDTDLAHRVRERGFRVIYQPLSVLYHLEGATSGTSVTEEGVKRYQTVNHAKFFARHKETIAGNKLPTTTAPGFEDRRSKLRMLIIDAHTATPDMDSGSNDMYQFLRIFKDFGFHITFVPENLMQFGRYTKDLQRLGVECLYRPFVNSLDEAIASLRQPIDVVLIYRFYVAEKVIDTVLKTFPRAKVVFDTVDVHFLRERRQADLLNSDELRKRSEETKARELEVMHKAHSTIVLTDYEQDLVREVAPDVACYRVPIARDIPGRSDTPWNDRRDILFVGGFEHPPNVDAVQHFAAHIWPLVRAKGLGARFIVIGSKMPEEVRQLASDDIIVKGFVPDLDSVLDNIRLTVAPLRYGSGVKGKVVTSLSHGIPCVASSVAVEGTHFKHDVHLLVADDPQAMADVIEQAYTQRDLWLRLSENGITASRELYSVQTVCRHLATLLHDLGIDVPVKESADAEA